MGSECSILKESLARKLKLTIRPSEDALVAFNKSIVIPLGRAETRLLLDGIKFTLDFLIVPDNSLSCDILVGRDIFKTPHLRAITSAKGTTLSRVAGDAELRGFSTKCVESVSQVELRPITKEDVKCGNQTVVDRLVTLLNKHRAIVALDNSHPLGAAKVPPMKIELSSDVPIYHRPYRLSVSDKQKVQEIVADLIDKGLASEGHSPYASPLVLTTKKNGQTRMCVDYRALNKITTRIKYPLPIPEDQIDTLKNKKIYISIDLKSGFHQIPIHPDSQKYTAFITPDGQYIYHRVPFGLCNGPAWFQKSIQDALRGLPVLIYIDDLLIPADDLEEAFRILEALMERLQAFNFTLCLAKCDFFQEAIDYLGREISSDGVRPGLHKIQALKNAPFPVTVKQVRQLIGLISWFRRFIPNLATLIAPLTELTRKDAAWVWGPAQIAACKKAVEILISRPILAIFDPNLRTELETDACKIGVGAMITQYDSDNVKRVIAYYSKKNSIEEQQYHSYDLETLAVYRALQHFRTYLLGIKFTLITDCSAIRATASKKDILPRVTRWWIYFQDFDFEIKYRPGAQGAHVDYLSRNPVDCRLIDVTESPGIELAQLQDADICIIKKIMDLDIRRPDTKQYFDNYNIKEGIVFRRTAEGDRWLVPRAFQFNVVQACHDFQGHRDMEGTLEKIRQSYWFGGMKRFVSKYVRSCRHCRKTLQCMQVDITDSEWIKVAQLQDPDICEIKDIILSGLNEPDTKTYFDNYDVKAGVVFRKTSEGYRWVVPKMARFNIVRLCHDEQGHFGIDKTLEKVKSNYWFKHMRKFVEKYVNACLHCIYYKSKRGRQPGFLNPIPKEPIPFHTLHLDHIGPFVKSKKKNEYILTIVCGFTKFTVLEPMKDTKAKPVLKVLDQLIAIFGVPVRIICDRGPAFKANRLRSYCEALGIKLILNAVATPRANGQCEKFNDTVVSALATMRAGEPEDKWDKYVKKVQSAINCTTHRVTRKTPLELLCGYKPRSNADAALIESIQARLQDLDLQEIRQEAKERIDKDQKRQKAYFDAKRRIAPEYNVGDIVMIPVQQKATGKSKKLEAKFKGPFRIVAKLPHDRYEVQDERDMQTRGRKTVVAVDQIKSWVLFDAAAQSDEG